MIDERFDPNDAGIAVPCVVAGPVKARVVNLLLDTGASDCVMNDDVMAEIGYSAADVIGSETAVTANGIISLDIIPILAMEAFGHTILGIHVRMYTMYPNSSVHGVIGKSFFRGGVLTIDFAQGLISFHPPPPPAAP